MYPVLDLSIISNQTNFVNLSPTDILGTSAIGLLNFKQRLNEKLTDTAMLESNRK